MSGSRRQILSDSYARARLRALLAAGVSFLSGDTVADEQVSDALRQVEAARQMLIVLQKARLSGRVVTIDDVQDEWHL